MIKKIKKTQKQIKISQKKRKKVKEREREKNPEKKKQKKLKENERNPEREQRVKKKKRRNHVLDQLEKRDHLYVVVHLPLLHHIHPFLLKETQGTENVVILITNVVKNLNKKERILKRNILRNKGKCK